MCLFYPVGEEKLLNDCEYSFSVVLFFALALPGSSREDAQR